LRRFTLVVAVAAAALLGAGIAVAALADGGTTKVAPTFTLTAASGEVAKCDGDDGAYTTEELSATGKIAAGPLAGQVALELTWVKSTPKNAGYAEGTLVVTDADETESVRADVIGAVSGSSARGSVVGSVGEDAAQRLIGTIAIARDGKKVTVKIGNGSLAGAAVVVSDTGCVLPETVSGDIVDIDLESRYLSVETDDGDYVTVDLTALQAGAIDKAGIGIGDSVTITYTVTDDGSAALTKIERQ
jgi:hypothetical protein